MSAAAPAGPGCAGGAKAGGVAGDGGGTARTAGVVGAEWQAEAKRRVAALAATSARASAPAEAKAHDCRGRRRSIAVALQISAGCNLVGNKIMAVGALV